MKQNQIRGPIVNNFLLANENLIWKQVYNYFRGLSKGSMEYCWNVCRPIYNFMRKESQFKFVHLRIPKIQVFKHWTGITCLDE